MKKAIFILCLFFANFALATDQSAINLYVQEAPEIREHAKLSSVTKYLSKKYKEEEDLAWAALAWIVYNIDYDDYFYRQVDKNNKTMRDLSYKIPKQGDIIKTRLGVCGDIAPLYSEMLTKLKIKSRVIYGCIAPPNDKRACKKNPHAWNAVWLNKQWELVDPTWAMGQAKALENISSKGAYEREIRKRERHSGNNDIYKPRTNRNIDASWFKVDPEEMAEDHQPNDKKWYLTKSSDRKRKN